MNATHSTYLLLGLLASTLLYVTSFLLPPAWVSIIAYAQTPAAKEVQTGLVPENGCPVSISSARTEFELDPFGTPLASRIYLTYKNDSDKAVAGVKFRIRFVDPSGKDRGTFQAPHAQEVQPGSTGTEKWRHEKVDPRATEAKVRVLMVKFSDGSIWQTGKLPQDIVMPQPQAGSASEGGLAGQ